MKDFAAATGLTIYRNARSDERLHGPFVLSAFILALTLGAEWGARIRFPIGFYGTFDAAHEAYNYCYDSDLCFKRS